jgi:hypothetical protein
LLLAIRRDRDDGLWTPFDATRHVGARLVFAQGRPVSAEDLRTGHLGGTVVAIAPSNCTGACSEGHRSVTLNVAAEGLVSLPYMRAYAAGKVAQEAATLVVSGMPEHLNPGKWADRAFTLASERAGAQQGGTARLPGVQLLDSPGIGSGEHGTSLFLGGSHEVTIPAGTCGLSGWQVSGQ